MSEAESRSKWSVHALYGELEPSALTHQKIISSIEALAQRNVVAYQANPGHPAGLLQDHDVDVLESILRTVDLDRYGRQLDFVIDSPGGLPNVAERMIRVCRSYSDGLRVVVPNSAMSAATLLALGADSILMSATSRLGPIDPQMLYPTKDRTTLRAARSFVDAYNDTIVRAQQAAAQDQPIDPFLHVLSGLDVSWIIECVRAQNATKALASQLLSDGMMKGTTEDTIKRAVDDLTNLGHAASHGSSIYREAAKEIGLEIECADHNSEHWTLIWDLFLRMQHYANSQGLAKYMASREGGINMQVQVRPGS